MTMASNRIHFFGVQTSCVFVFCSFSGTYRTNNSHQLHQLRLYLFRSLLSDSSTFPSARTAIIRTLYRRPDGHNGRVFLFGSRKKKTVVQKSVHDQRKMVKMKTYAYGCLWNVIWFIDVYRCLDVGKFWKLSETEQKKCERKQLKKWF